MRKQAVIGVITMAVAIGTVGAVGTGALGGSSASPSGAGAGAGAGSEPSGTGTGIEAKGGVLGRGTQVPGNLKAIGLTADQRLVLFRVDKPGAAAPLGRVSGLKGDRKLIGIDYRVQNNKLYGVGDKGGIYL